MSISPNEAQAMLADVDDVVARVKQSQIYRISSGVMMMWGVLNVLGNLLSPLAGRWAPGTWIVDNLIGIAITVAMLKRAPAPFAFPWR